jgi:hypothetical protein
MLMLVAMTVSVGLVVAMLVISIYRAHPAASIRFLS